MCGGVNRSLLTSGQIADCVCMFLFRMNLCAATCTVCVCGRIIIVLKRTRRITTDSYDTIDFPSSPPPPEKLHAYTIIYVTRYNNNVGHRLNTA